VAAQRLQQFKDWANSPLTNSVIDAYKERTDLLLQTQVGSAPPLAQKLAGLATDAIAAWTSTKAFADSVLAAIGTIAPNIVSLGQPQSTLAGDDTGDSVVLQHAVVTTDEIDSLVAAAIARWAAAGLDGPRLDRLRDLRFAILDLEGNRLGAELDGVIYLDQDAAGFGWFKDATPLIDEEFDAGLQARADGGADGRMDLLTTLAHEMGHYLGLDHNNDPFNVMYDFLGTSLRRLPTAVDVDHLRATDTAMSVF
jgi:hypothetical protein